jgi:hypothetical protein
MVTRRPLGFSGIDMSGDSLMYLPYKALVHRITATDLIIDQANRPIAHQIYRLAADKIAVVERRSTPDGGNTR